MSEAFCQSCGAPLDPGAKFCKSCGTPTPPPVYQASNEPAAPGPQASYPVPPPAFQSAGNGYTHYSQPQAYESAGNAPLSVGQYIGMIILSGLPIAGFILLLIWAFSSDQNVNKKNYARAVLILALIGIALSIIFGAAAIGLLTNLFSEYR